MAIVKRIYKYRLEEKESNWIDMPHDAVIMCAKLIGSCMFIFAEVEVDKDTPLINNLITEKRLIKAYTTGVDIPTDRNGEIQGNYIDTVIMNCNGAWHLYNMG
jgi:hypothetical protein